MHSIIHFKWISKLRATQRNTTPALKTKYKYNRTTIDQLILSLLQYSRYYIHFKRDKAVL